MCRRWLLYLLILVSLFGASYWITIITHKPSFEELIEARKRVTVKVLASNDDDENVYFGSGVIVDKHGFVLTANHVVNARETIMVQFYGSPFPHKAFVIQSSPELDLALLFIDSEQGVMTEQAPISRALRIRVGQRIFAIGNPSSFKWVTIDGMITKIGYYRDNRDVLAYYFFTNAALNPGMSGGPLFDMEGNLIGLMNSIYSPHGAQVGINLCTHGEDIVRFLNDYDLGISEDTPKLPVIPKLQLPKRGKKLKK